MQIYLTKVTHQQLLTMFTIVIMQIMVKLEN